MLKKLIPVLLILGAIYCFIDGYFKGQGARAREREEFKKNKSQTTETLSTIEYALMQEARIKNIELVAENRNRMYENPELTKLGISKEIQHCVKGWSQNTGIEESLIYAVIEYESAYNPELIANSDYGLMQINQINIDYYMNFYNGNLNPLDINDNIYMGTQILKNNYKKDDLHYTLMCYNMGQKKTNELRAKNIYSSEYSRKITEVMKRYKKLLGE